MITSKDDMIENEIKRSLEEKWICPECGEYKKNDQRISVGMKCEHCTYNGRD